MEISGSSSVNPISSPVYSRYLTPADVIERSRQKSRTEEETILETYYSSYDSDGFPGQRINLLA